MSNIKRDLYSNLKFFQAMTPQDVASGAATNGLAIDTLGYDGVVFVINCGAMTSAGSLAAAERWQLKLEHALADTYDTAASASAGTWSEVYPSQMIHSVIGMAGAYSTLNSGIFQSIASVADISITGKLFFVGYKGPRRFVRIAFSEVGGASTISASAIAVLGGAQIWPVNSPVGD
jgi:hypothetical protein